MKVIDLLNKIANGEAPTIIKFQNYIWTLNKQFKDYSDDDRYLLCDYMPDVVSIEEFLNDEVEIIEEEKKIPEKIPSNYYLENDDIIKDTFYRKINEIIDYLQSKGDK